MPRTAAKVTQADIARAARVARQLGGFLVEVTPDGTIRLVQCQEQIESNGSQPDPIHIGERPVM